MSISAQQTTAKLDFFHKLVSDWESTNKVTPESQIFSRPPPVAGGEREGKDVIVAFRTRPPLDHEFERFDREKALALDDQAGETDADAPGPAAGEEKSLKETYKPGISVVSAEPGVMVAHVPGMKWSGPTLTQKKFAADLAFGPSIPNEEVYQRTVIAQDILGLVLGGGVGCIMAYGQTGAGKTYTMEALEHHIARDLFPAADSFAEKFYSSSAEGENEGKFLTGNDVFEFHVTFLELLGKNARDLVGVRDGDDDDETALKEFKKVDIVEDKAGYVRPILVSTKVTNAEELSSLITNSLAHRRTSMTARNTSSSRSHAVLTIRVVNKVERRIEEGELILIDLAGSERYDDSKAHSKELMDQSRENNKSLSNLKECVRTRAKASIEEDGVVHIPFRTNKLTLLLKSIFDLESMRLSNTVVIAHVSPHIQDSSHSVSTLSYAAPFLVIPPNSNATKSKAAAKAPKVVENDPRTWDHEFTKTWLERQQKRYLKRQREAQRRVEEKHAKMRAPGKTSVAKPQTGAKIDEDKLLIETSKFLPGGLTGKHLARYYMAEWLNDWVKAAASDVDGAPPGSKWKDMVKDGGLEIYGEFTYKLLNARTQTRNAILKSRNKASSADIYGEKPEGYNHESNDWNITDEQWKVFFKHKDLEYRQEVENAIEGYQSRNPETEVSDEKKEQILKDVKMQMWNNWHDEVRTESSKELEEIAKASWSLGTKRGLDRGGQFKMTRDKLDRYLAMVLEEKQVNVNDYIKNMTGE